MLELADDTQDARLALTPIITLVHISKWAFCLRHARFLLCYRFATDIFYCQQPRNPAVLRRCLRTSKRATRSRTEANHPQHLSPAANRSPRRNESLSHPKRPSTRYGYAFRRRSSARRQLSFLSHLSLHKTAMHPNLRNLPNPSETTFLSPKITKEPCKNAGRGLRNL
jgi:hypothetical protein